MRTFGGSVMRLIGILCCVVALLGAVEMSSFDRHASIEERTVLGSEIELVVDVECGRGCTFILSPADQKAIAGGGVAAWTAFASRACGASIPCNAMVLAGAAMATMYVSEYGSDTCDMHIKIRPMGITTAVLVTHELRCAGAASPAD